MTTYPRRILDASMLSAPVTMLRRVKLDAVARLLDAWPWTQRSLTGTPKMSTVRPSLLALPSSVSHL